jgi:hypothetical protein
MPPQRSFCSILTASIPNFLSFQISFGNGQNYYCVGGIFKLCGGTLSAHLQIVSIPTLHQSATHAWTGYHRIVGRFHTRTGQPTNLRQWISIYCAAPKIEYSSLINSVSALLAGSPANRRCALHTRRTSGKHTASSAITGRDFRPGLHGPLRRIFQLPPEH